MLQPLRANPQRVRIADSRSVPAPVEGWDAISPLAAMKPTRAVVLDNWFPQPGYVEMRGGYSAWATGIVSGSTPVQSLMVYNALTAASNKMFAAAGTAVYDVSSSGAVGAAVLSSTGNARWNYVNYTTSAGTAYLFAVNGQMTARHYNGSAWAEPSITGVTSSDIINVNVFKKRIWGILNASMDACYLPLDSVAGAATEFPLGSVMGKGGFLLAMGTWTRDSGTGPDDYAVFVSSKGQVAVYAGTDPDTDFVLQGVYDIAPPIGRKCLTKLQGDLAVITMEGVAPLSKIAAIDVGSTATIALSQRINNAMNASARQYSGNFGWEFTHFPKQTAMVLNVPIAENSSAHQYVMNTLTGAWCRFTGWDVNCFAVFNDNLYMGTNVGTVVRAWNGGIDGSIAIAARGQTAYNYFGLPGRDKRFTAIQPLITTDQTFDPAVGISTDFQDNAVVGTPSVVSTASALYDQALYDTGVYADESRASINWFAVYGIGQCAAIHFRSDTSVSGNAIVRVNGFNITFEVGEFY